MRGTEVKWYKYGKTIKNGAGKTIQEITKDLNLDRDGLFQKETCHSGSRIGESWRK